MTEIGMTSGTGLGGTGFGGFGTTDTDFGSFADGTTGNVGTSTTIAQATIPGTEPTRSFGSRQEAEAYLKAELLRRKDEPDSDGDVGFIFESGGRYYLYGPDNLESFGGNGEPLGMNRLGDAYRSRQSAADHALGDDANFVSGGILINGHYHSLSDNGQGVMQLGNPTRRL